MQQSFILDLLLTTKTPIKKEFVMESDLNELELYLLENIINSNEKYFFLKKQLVDLKVKSRQFTGVGAYIYFNVKTEITSEITNLDFQKSAFLSCEKLLIINNVEAPISFELNITDSKIDFLELVINGDEHWDGNFDNFKLINF